MKLFPSIILLIGVITALHQFCRAEDVAPAETPPESPTPMEKTAKIPICFVISARKLPHTDTLNTMAPSGYVRIEYSGSPSTDRIPQIYNTTTVNSNHNPDWPDIFHISYIPGKGQLLTFTVFDHNRFSSDSDIGTVDISVGQMEKALHRKLTLDLTSSKKESGQLILFMSVNHTLYEDTEKRLRNVKNRKIRTIGGHYKVKFEEEE